jgi:hypothetical protein
MDKINTNSSNKILKRQTILLINHLKHKRRERRTNIINI